MPRYDKRLTIVIPASLQAQANALAAQIDTGGAGHLTFTVPLYPRGGPQTQPVAYWCGWAVTDQQHAALLARFGGESARRPGRVFDGHAVGPEAVLAAMRLERRRAEMDEPGRPGRN